MSTLYIVATPIGNLEDITLRALRILGEVDLVLCEDTRVTKKLLDKYEIKTKTMSYHSHSKLSKVEKIFSLLEDGKNLALVSDAGTPTISDPGVLLIQQVKEKFGGEVKIEPIPGASALIAALSASGISSANFLFLGFLPHKKGRETLFKEIAESKYPVIFYESTHRIIKTLEALSLHLAQHLEVGPPNKNLQKKKIVIGRELTKIYEEFIEGSADEILNQLKDNPKKQKGEFVVIVDGEK